MPKLFRQYLGTRSFLYRVLIITFELPNGWFFCEDLGDHFRVFIHKRNAVGNRYLHSGDIIAFHRVPSTKQPGKFEGINIEYIDHVGDPAPISWVRR
jgi:hypothetical protein